ncbi:AzlC family ABC transporter permease [Amycolatopsis sp., V23-08]|uniref:AzlC family ABC transporter permease n=1 Tax=Amycolatopsis heterodermiae TaxID=3110235 RepID=A0ABU5RFX2_9PSEU|nr:AzlC family ABC transporter permease [Amycolatopsis sp., V23-08]MEA5365175.1 AzlC family ABC transporter permease [Amycolatopsis sp., V23-08]
MRSIWRTLDRALARDIGLVCLADCLVGVSYGAIAVGSGFPIWAPMLMSLLVFAGASQFMFIGIVASGGNPFAAVLAGLLVNARHLPFGFAIGDVLGKRWGARLAGSHLMSDETVAFALAQEELHRRRATYWACGIGLFTCWNIGVVVGATAGSAISDTDAFGLDAAFPAVLLALVLPTLRDRAARLPVLLGVVIALVAVPFVPAGVPVLLALVGVLAGVAAREPEPEKQEVG